MQTELNLAEINAVVVELLNERMGRFGFDHAEIHARSDHVIADYKAVSWPSK